MSTPLLIPVGYQFFDNAGHPLSGGFLYTYVAGTTPGTPQATYSDDALSVLNPNPIPLNSAGRCAVSGVEVNVYPISASYKLVLTDSALVQVWSHDQIDPAAPFNLTLNFTFTAGYTVIGGGSSGLTAVANGAPIEVALTDTATPALDASLGTVFTLSATGDRTIAVPTNATKGQKIIIRHFASGGARTLALNSGTGGFGFGSDITGLTQTASGKTDYIGAVYNLSLNLWHIVGYVKGY
jgi:hypothetical protein